MLLSNWTVLRFLKDTLFPINPPLFLSKPFHIKDHAQISLSSALLFLYKVFKSANISRTFILPLFYNSLCLVTVFHAFIIFPMHFGWVFVPNSYLNIPAFPLESNIVHCACPCMYMWRWAESTSWVEKLVDLAQGLSVPLVQGLQRPVPHRDVTTWPLENATARWSCTLFFHP